MGHRDGVPRTLGLRLGILYGLGLMLSRFLGTDPTALGRIAGPIVGLITVIYCLARLVQLSSPAAEAAPRSPVKRPFAGDLVAAGAHLFVLSPFFSALALALSPRPSYAPGPLGPTVTSILEWVALFGFRYALLAVLWVGWAKNRRWAFGIGMAYGLPRVAAALIELARMRPETPPFLS